MLRKSVVILVMLLSSLATQVYALGLGTVTVESALNQPLRVRIEVLQLGDTRLDDVSVQMASVDDFQRFNIERVGFLSNIRFNLESGITGNYVVLTSNQIVREPYLSFILETRWPNGRLLSEHTILLDLPVFDDQQSGTSVRQPISPVLQRPGGIQSNQAVVEPFAPATPTITPPTQSVQPVLEPEDISGAQGDVLDSSQEIVQIESEPVAESEVLEEVASEPETVAVEETPEPEPVIVAEEEPAVETEQVLVAEDEPEPVEEEAPVEEVATEEIEEAVEAVEEEIAEEEPVEIAEEEPEAIEAEEVVPEPATPETIETTDSDTLSSIALRVRPDSSVSVEQTMLAIQRLNPDAFADGNINRLLSGQVLRVPDLAEIEQLDAREAVDEVTRQNQQLAADVQPLAAPTDVTQTQTDQPQGQLSVVTSDDAIDASAGAGELGDEENAELDRRIAELENQLALRQEEADRARLEREELASRMAELEEQIASAQEIIRLQDLQLSQLQESLAQAAAEAEAEAAQAAAIAAAEAEAATPVPTSTSLVDDVMRILTGNTMMMIFGVVLVILLLVFLLLRRNKAAKLETSDLDKLADQEFGDDGESVSDSESEDDARDDLDSELDDIIQSGEEADEGGAEDGDIVESDDPISRAEVFLEHGQLENAEELLKEALEEQPDNTDIRLKLLDVVSRKDDLAAFEEHADMLTAEMSPVIDRKVNSFRQNLSAVSGSEEAVEEAAEEIADLNADDEAPVVEATKGEAEAGTSSFLDDLGIDLDSFDDESFEFSEEFDESREEEESDKAEQEDTSDSESVEEAKSDDLDLTFDLSAGDDATVIDEVSIEAEENKDGAQEEIEPVLDSLELDAGEDAEGELVIGDSKDADDLDIDTLDFGSGDDDSEEPAAEDSSVADEDLDLETFAFDTDDLPAADAEQESVADVGEDENSLDFDFDKDDVKVEVNEESAEADLETFDFDLDSDSEADSTDTIVEKPEDDQPAVEEEIEEISFDAIDDAEPDDEGISEGSAEEGELETPAEQAGEDDDLDMEGFLGEADTELSSESAIGSDASDSADDEFDINLDEFEIGETADEVPAVEADDSAGEDDDDDFFDLDEAVAAEIVSDGDEIDFSAEEPEAIIDEEDDLEDLGFLSDDDEVEIESIDDVEEVELLSDDDEAATKLELAYAYQKMGDVEGAKEILQEVIKEGTDEQVKEAERLISSMDSSD